jgi:hypothetical protein
MYAGVLWGNLRKRDHLEDAGVDGRIILKRTLKKRNWEEWAGLLWVRIERVGGRLLMRQ